MTKFVKLNIARIALLGWTLMFSVSSHAQQDDGLVGMLQRFGAVLTEGANLAIIFSYLAGIVCFIMAFLVFRSMSNQQGRNEPGKVIGLVCLFLAGIGLVYLGSTIEVGGETAFGGSGNALDGQGTLNLN